jgi:uncharacterized protein YdeI (BOF family)
MNKQTAVEFLEDKLSQVLDWDLLELFQQAKAMEKEQMIDFARNIIIDATCSVEGYVTTEKDIDHYYLETYGGEYEE